MSAEGMTPAKATALRKPFPPESVGKLPKGGTLLDYVGHAAITDRLLTVDPEWSWEPVAVDPNTGMPLLDFEGNLWIRLTVCGVTRYGVGDGKSAKERIGDALRNAAMRYGVALDLWAKENLVEFERAIAFHQPSDAGDPEALIASVEQGSATPPASEPSTDKPMTARTRGQLFALFSQKGVPEAEQLPGINALTRKEYTSRADLTDRDASAVITALKMRPDATPATTEEPTA